MEIENKQSASVGKREIICAYIVKNGRRIYPRTSRYFHFWVDETPINVNEPRQESIFNDFED